MRTNRKFTAILLSLVMAFSLLPVSAFAAEAITVSGPSDKVGKSATSITLTITNTTAPTSDITVTPSDVSIQEKDGQGSSTNLTSQSASTVSSSNKDVTISLSGATLEYGKTYTLTFTLTPSDTTDLTALTNGSVEFTVEDDPGSSSQKPEYSVTVEAAFAQTTGKKQTTVTITVKPTTTGTAPSTEPTAEDLVTPTIKLMKDTTEVTGATIGAVAWSGNVGTSTIDMGELEDGDYTAKITFAYKQTDENADYTISTDAISDITTQAVSYVAPTGGSEVDPDPGTDPTKPSFGTTATATAVEGHPENFDLVFSINRGFVESAEGFEIEAAMKDADNKPVEITNWTATPTLEGNVINYAGTFTVPKATEAKTYTLNIAATYEDTSTLTRATATISKDVEVKYDPNGGGTTTPGDDTTLDDALNDIPATGEIPEETATTAITAIKDMAPDTSASKTEKDNFAEEVLDNVGTIERLEAATNVTPSVTTSSNVPTGLTIGKVVGLGLSKTPTGTPSISMGKAANTHSVDSSINSETATFFSLNVAGVKATLDFPVVITVGVPAALRNSGLKVLHYTSGNTSEELKFEATVGYTSVSFVTYSFSDFALVSTTGGGTSTPTDPTNPGTPSTPGSSNTPHKGGSSGGGSSAKPATSTTPTTPNNGGTTVTTTPTQVFKDIPANHWASAQIKWAYDNKCMNGTGDGAFTPNGTVTRQALWMVLARLAGSNPADMAAAKAWAVENSISDGTTPSGAVSRQQLVTILYRFAQMMAKDTQGAAELSSYPDAASVASYAQDALAWAVGNGIVSGTSDGRLNPEGSATRAQFAVILYRFYNGEQAQ